MPSRAEMRVRLENVLRAVAIAVLVAMLWQSLHDQDGSARQSLNARGIGALGMWSAMPNAPSALRVRLDSVPSRLERAWLGALAGAGSTVTWTGDLLPVM